MYTVFNRFFTLSVSYRFTPNLLTTDLPRTAKPGNDWSDLELDAYNITVQRTDVVTFFGHQPGPVELDPNLFSTMDTSTEAAHNLSPETYRFLTTLYMATHPSPVQERAIDDFAKTVLEVMRFDGIGTMLRTCLDIPLAICGVNGRMEAKADVCLIHCSTTILLAVQEDRLLSSVNPEPQVIAEAIAAFQHNNRKREEFGLEVLQEMTISCITMIGTCPIFYKVPVTKELSHCVAVGQYPRTPTVVEKWCIPRRVLKACKQ